MTKDIEALNQLRAKPAPSPKVEPLPETILAYVIAPKKFCPYCGNLEAFRRLANSTEVFLSDEAETKVKVFASCNACYFDWWEVYSLTGVEAT